MTDPVAVGADLMAEADALMDSDAASYSVPDDWRGLPAFTDLRDAIYAALQAAEERGAERMREPTPAMIEAAEAELAAVLAGHHYVMPQDGVRRVLAAVIRALPTDKET